MDQVNKKLKVALDDWSMMQKTNGDEGAEWAERFERHFYEFIDEVKRWYSQLENPPATVEEAEESVEIESIMESLPGPLILNFLTELEDIIDGLEHKRFD